MSDVTSDIVLLRAKRIREQEAFLWCEESTRVVCERPTALPSSFRKTLTRDRGTENMGWTTIEQRLSLNVYFARVSDEEIRRIKYLLNTHPRKRFGGKTPLEVLLEKTGVAITY